MGAHALGAVLGGSVIEGWSGRPLARAAVVLEQRQSADNLGTQRVLSNSAGQFEFAGLPAGMYLLHVEKKGYARADYGQKEHGGPGTPILLENQASFRALVNLHKLGAITGDVVDENDVGLPEVTVHAYRMGDRPSQVAAVRTDDRGVFRLAGLAPGSYLVRTAAKRLEDGLDLMPTYYPAEASATKATRLEVMLDKETSGVILAPLIGELAEITGSLPTSGTVLLISEFSLREAPGRQAGSFRFESVEPGQYSVVAVSADGAYAAYQEIAVGSEDRVANLEMSTTPELRLLCEANSGAPLDFDDVSFFFRRAEMDDSPQQLHCGQSAVFPPGRWQVAAAPPAHLYVAAILETGSDSGIQEVLLRPGESRELRIVFGAPPAALDGQVRTEDGEVLIGAPVFLRAMSAELGRRVGGVRHTRTAPDGIFRLPGLPPGRYELLSSYQIRDPEVEVWPAGLAVTVELVEGEERTANLQLTRIR